MTSKFKEVEESKYKIGTQVLNMFAFFLENEDPTMCESCFIVSSDSDQDEYSIKVTVNVVRKVTE